MSAWVLGTVHRLTSPIPHLNLLLFIVMIIQHPRYHQQVRTEIQTFSITHGLSRSGPEFVSGLGSLPFRSIETDLPILGVCIEETVRLINIGVHPRQNMGPDVVIGGSTIKRGDFIFLAPEDVHMDPLLYDDPSTFNPYREHHRLQGGADHLGWGYGSCGLFLIRSKR
jgi:cytochrome P450